MMGHPRLSIGLPVRNGERYLLESVGSLLAQTHADFRLIIADNASTDGTEELCRELVRRDPRVTYVRHAVDIGAARNFNFVFRQTRGEYFKWAAHDDLCGPEFLARCIERLDADPGVVLCHSYADWVNAEGEVTGPALRGCGLTSERPGARFIAAMTMSYPVVIWGVMRRDAAEGTGLIASFVGSDRYFLGEMMLRGRADLVPESLFAVRQHGESFTDNYYRMSHRNRRRWFDPRMRLGGVAGMVSAAARLVRRFSSESLPLGERAACVAYFAQRCGGFVGRRTAEAAAGTMRGLAAWAWPLSRMGVGGVDRPSRGAPRWPR